MSHDVSDAAVADTHGAPLPYQYVVLRAVPRVERGEYVNVGVLLYCQAADLLRCGWRLDPARLIPLDAAVDLDGLADALATVERICVSTATSAAGPSGLPLGQRFGWLAAPRSTVLQPGPMHAGVTHDPDAELARLMTRYVVPPVSDPRLAAAVDRSPIDESRWARSRDITALE